MRARVVIDERFRGPPASANGGYACGLVGREIAGAAWVSLRLPPPLARPMTLQERGGEELELRDGDDLVADGGAAELAQEVPEPPTPDEAARAVEHFRWWDDHPFPDCFVCGPGRGETDGLRIFPGQVSDRRIVASPWTPDPSLPGTDG